MHDRDRDAELLAWQTPQPGADEASPWEMNECVSHHPATAAGGLSIKL